MVISMLKSCFLVDSNLGHVKKIVGADLAKSKKLHFPHKQTDIEIWDRVPISFRPEDESHFGQRPDLIWV